ncbi:hypothetical protein H0R92_13925 [Treponema sp. OMZ 840]|uniref:hypothetical protein n=1 Tax=Treponema sp. OMZ 840 TaxID=244313 RepID=UPI003D8EEE18
MYSFAGHPLIARIPAGKFTVAVKTKYSAGASPLKEVREIVYKTALTVNRIYNVSAF